jgi:hypothetical protein
MYPYFQFSVDLASREECEDVFKSFERKGIAAAIVYDEDKLLPWSVWKEGLEHVGRTSASRPSRRKKNTTASQFNKPNTIPIYGAIWQDCHEFAEFIDVWGQGLPKGGHPKILNAIQRRECRKKYKELHMTIKELAIHYNCNDSTIAGYLKEADPEDASNVVKLNGYKASKKIKAVG